MWESEDGRRTADIRLTNLLYYLRAEKDTQSLAYPPRLAVDLGSYMDGEAHGCGLGSHIIWLL